METLVNEHLADRAARLGDTFSADLRSLDAPIVRAVRGRGLMIGIELKRKVGPLLAQLMDVAGRPQCPPAPSTTHHSRK
jgi:acetylornithine/succinyldiaminopimelate/putrescine aminotransferase